MRSVGGRLVSVDVDAARSAHPSQNAKAGLTTLVELPSRMPRRLGESPDALGHELPGAERPPTLATGRSSCALTPAGLLAVDNVLSHADPTHPPLYFSHPACLEHDPRVYMPEHPDTPERLEAIEHALARGLARAGSGARLRRRTEAQLELIHSARHVERIKELSLAGGGAVDPDTIVGEPSYRAALHAAGGACEMTRALMAGEARVGVLRGATLGPSRRTRSGDGLLPVQQRRGRGRLAIRELGAGRVFILDWDVHHGNGTAEAFRRRKDVLFASIHQSGIYPGQRRLSDVGSGPGEGYTINLPVPSGSEEDLWLSLIEHIVLPAAREFAPDLVLLSAGFDAHRDDPLAGCLLETAPSRRWPATSASSPASSRCRSERSWRVAMTRPRSRMRGRDAGRAGRR